MSCDGALAASPHRPSPLLLRVWTTQDPRQPYWGASSPLAPHTEAEAAGPRDQAGTPFAAPEEPEHGHGKVPRGQWRVDAPGSIWPALGPSPSSVWLALGPSPGTGTDGTFTLLLSGSLGYAGG